MKPIDFKEKNIDIAKEQLQYITLPAYHSKDDNGEVIFCMSANFWERVVFLFTGKMWCSLWTFNKPLQPSKFGVFKKDFLKSE